MSYVFSTPAGLLTLFALGVEAVIGVILSAATGLSEFHKDVLVLFAVGFPVAILLIIWSLVSTRREDDPSI